jgi:chromosome segregation ATPase
MNEIVENSTVLLKDNKIENASEMVSISTEYVDRIKGLEDDTIQLEMAYKLDRFKRMHDNFAPVLAQYESLLASVLAEKAVLKKLKGDINQAEGKRHKYDEYLSFEEKKVTELESSITLYVERKELIVKTYDELHNEINEMLVERFTADEVQ